MVLTSNAADHILYTHTPCPLLRMPCLILFLSAQEGEGSEVFYLRVLQQPTMYLAEKSINLPTPTAPTPFFDDASVFNRPA